LKMPKEARLYPLRVKPGLPCILDTDILEDFRERADKTGYGYQTMINEALREYLSKPEAVAKTPVELNRPRRDQFNMIFYTAMPLVYLANLLSLLVHIRHRQQ